MLQVIGDMFVSIGMCNEAVSAFTKVLSVSYQSYTFYSIVFIINCLSIEQWLR